MMTNTQIDRLGNRLKGGSIEDEDLRLLDNYRRSFLEAYSVVVETIRDQLNLNPTGRPAKSTTSIIDKLRRESIRLTQMQDIAGCRIVVEKVVDQERIIEEIKGCFDSLLVIDRRKHPSYGYRAVHLIIKYREKKIEVQLRTELQHSWAELSEKLSDKDPMIKYGGGNKKMLDFLYRLSRILSKFELLEKTPYDADVTNPIRREIMDIFNDIALELESKGDIDAFLDSI